jgi:pyrimidine-nucleoside phosphorylase
MSDNHFHPPSLIEKKRDGALLSAEEIRWFIDAFTRGEVADAQMSALAMAIYFRGFDAVETAAMTQAMLESGDVFAWPTDRPRVVDKHSTGGIGDKVSLVLAPLLACDDLWVPMVSGRGLGITGGTLDKLEAIPGYRTDLGFDECLRQLQKVGCFISGQTADICPADKKLYALRDVTGTVPSQALIVASIMSKKLAESLDALVLDVKFGSGAFMKTEADAVSLADAMRDAGRAMNVDVRYKLTPMNEPLGCTVGNALEVQEAIETLKGGGPADFVELTLDLASEISSLSRDALVGKLRDGSAWAKFVAMVEAQGGDVSVLDDFLSHHAAPVVRAFEAPDSGVLMKVDAATLGQTCLELGAGRAHADDRIDFAVGMSGIQKVGAKVAKGDVLLMVHARTEDDCEFALEKVRKGILIQ